MASAWALIEHNDEILFVRRALDRGRGGQWCLPGGTIWKNERPDVACVREAFEETGLRVTVRKPIAQFKDAHYFLCTLNVPRASMVLREQECIDSTWTRSMRILTLGTVMDLRRMIPLLQLTGHPLPRLPRGLRPAVPELLF
ncbi:MAG: NUDIX hydrolase [Myxococcota bacterium]